MYILFSKLQNEFETYLLFNFLSAEDFAWSPYADNYNQYCVLSIGAL